MEPAEWRASLVIASFLYNEGVISSPSSSCIMDGFVGISHDKRLCYQLPLHMLKGMHNAAIKGSALDFDVEFSARMLFSSNAEAMFDIDYSVSRTLQVVMEKNWPPIFCESIPGDNAPSIPEWRVSEVQERFVDKFRGHELISKVCNGNLDLVFFSEWIVQRSDNHEWISFLCHSHRIGSAAVFAPEPESRIANYPVDDNAMFGPCWEVLTPVASVTSWATVAEPNIENFDFFHQR